MALIFPRVARNFIKNGYFPTDSATLAAIFSALDVEPGRLRIVDPCCGEGAALSEISGHLTGCGAQTHTFGIELDEERAWHAKSVLDTVAHADVHDVRVTDRSFGLLFLNPPYGDLIGDALYAKEGAGRLRHEKVFCKRTFNLLQVGGVLVLIVPFYVLDHELSSFIARHFEQVTAHLAPEQQFKQAVILGVKRKPGAPAAAVVEMLEAFGRGENHVTLPEVWPQEPYTVPVVKPSEDFTFTVIRLDARQLAAELDAGLTTSSLWSRFDDLLKVRLASARPPLRAMSDWHLALALAAGQICGVVTSDSGRRLLVKGRTTKVKDKQIQVDAREDGTEVTTQVLTDRFVTVIRAIDFTPGPDLGRLVTIQ